MTFRKGHPGYWKGKKNPKQAEIMKKKNPFKRPEVREKLKRNQWTKSGKWSTEEIKIKIAGHKKGKTYEEIYGMKKAIELKKKISDGMIGKNVGNLISEEVRNKLKISAKRRANTKEGRDRLRNNRLNQKFNRTSKAEEILEDYLKNKKISFVHPYKYKFGFADFYLPKKNLIVHCNGSYWHNKPNVKIRDKKQNKWLKENGFKILTIKSEDIVKNRNNLNIYGPLFQR